METPFSVTRHLSVVQILPESSEQNTHSAVAGQNFSTPEGVY